MKPCTFEDALSEAETACAEHIYQTTGMTVCVATNDRGLTDCAVFDIGRLDSGEVAAFPSNAWHFRASVDLYNRDRAALQRWIMLILEGMHIGRNWFSGHHLREDSNVTNFQVAPEANAVSEIKTTNVSTSTNAQPVPTYTASVEFDVVFISKGGGEGNTDWR